MASEPDGWVKRAVLYGALIIIAVVVGLIIVSVVYPGEATQITSNIALVMITGVLGVATLLYVRLTHRLATEAKRTNDMAQRDTERRLRMSAPSLRVQFGNRDLIQEQWRFSYILSNVGNGVAHRVQLHTTAGSGEVLTLERGKNQV